MSFEHLEILLPLTHVRKGDEVVKEEREGERDTHRAIVTPNA